MPASAPDRQPRQRPFYVIPPSPGLKRDPVLRNHKGPHLLTLALLLLALLALARLLFALNTPATTTTSTASPAPIDCSSLLRTFDYTKNIDLQSGAQLGAIDPANQLDGGSPAELVQVMHSDAQHTLDVYLFGCSIHQNRPGLTTLFTQHSLVDGTVEISQANTLITGTLDTSLPAGAGALLLPSQQFIYREYAWQDGAFQQVIFPGFYPVTSRAEAEVLQQQADSGQNLAWSDPLATAEAMAKDLLHWPGTGRQNVLLDSDGTTAHVKLVQQNPPLAVNVTLQRLVRPDSKGLWFVVSAHTQGVTLGLNGQDMTALPQDSTPATPTTTQTAQQALVQSPITLRGTSVLADGQASATLFDHTLSPISSANNVPLQVNSDGTYSGTLSYTVDSPGQEGVLLVRSLPGAANDAVEQGQLLLVPVLLG